MKQIRSFLPTQQIRIRADAAVVANVNSFGYSGTIASALLRRVGQMLASPMKNAFRRRMFVVFVNIPQSEIIRSCFHESGMNTTISIDKLLGIINGLTRENSVEADSPVMQAGVDSNAAIELLGVLKSTSRSVTQLPETLIFDFPTPRKLAAFLAGNGSEPQTHLSQKANRFTADVYVGACRANLPARMAFPTGTVQLWGQGNFDAISQVPLARWSREALPSMLEPVSSRVRHGGFIHGAALFDNSHFRISAAEVRFLCNLCLFTHASSPV